jgi:MarR family transcriptional regulator, transcriptional regulator for hemolysin
MTQDRRKKEQDLIMLLNFVSRVYRKVVNRVLATHGLSDSQALPILLLSRLGDGVRTGVLADHVGVEVPSLVRQVDQLCAAGLMERREDPADRRVKILHLTDEGRRQAAALEILIQDVRSPLLWHIKNEDLETTLAALKGFEAALSGDMAEKG